MSKSIFLNQSSDAKSVFNPVIGAGDLSLLDKPNYDLLVTLDNFYAIYASQQNYQYIVQDYNFFITLYNQINNIQARTTDYRMTMLMKLILELFVSGRDVAVLNGSNIVLKTQKANLQKQILDILSNKNVKNIDTVGGTGQMNITKNFKLAPIYNYYITVYGMPQNGAGFDKVKLGYLANILTLNKIDPYK
jgi:hypothetical protein